MGLLLIASPEELPFIMTKPLLPVTRLPMIRILLITSGVIIILDCLALIALGKINFGTVVPLMIGIIFVVHGVYWLRIRQFIERNRLLKRLWYGLWVLFVLWLISFGIFIGSLQQQIELSKQPVAQVAAIMILGSGTEDGRPTPTLAERLDRAVPIIKAQPQALVITTGGIGFGRTQSEAEVMANYLHKVHNIAFARVLQEGKSTSTEENMSYSQALLAQHQVSLDEPIAIVTSDFHTIRAVAIARHQGYEQPIAVASTTPLSIRYNSWFREYFAFVSGWLLGEY